MEKSSPSLRGRASKTLKEVRVLLQGLSSGRVQNDVDAIADTKAAIRTQIEALVAELSAPGGPNASRVNSYFTHLLFGSGKSLRHERLPANPRQVRGSLGRLRDQVGLRFPTQGYANSVEDEQNATNFRILVDYVTSLAQSWVDNTKGRPKPKK